MGNCKGWSLAAALLTALMLMSLVGCGGGGGGGGAPSTTTGSVSGDAKDFVSRVGIGNVTVSVAGRSATTDANGHFQVTGIAPGGPYTLTITPPVGFVLPPGSTTIQVSVIAGQDKALGAPVSLFDENDLPPNPPPTSGS